VLDIMNDAHTIRMAFADYYRTTVLAEETDPGKLHDLKAALDGYQAYAVAEVHEFVARFLGGGDRDMHDPILGARVADYRERLDEDGHVGFKDKARTLQRAYGFLLSILPYTMAEWEKLSIYLTFLVPKLPAPVEEDLAEGILEATDMDSYRVEKGAAARIQLSDEEAEIQPVATLAAATSPSPSSTGCQISSRPSTTSSGTFSGAMPTACRSSSPRASRAKSRRPRRIRALDRTPTSRTRGSSTKRRWHAS
jgi:type I restriction enzyme, R subunit